ncbi:MAG TPA: heme-binding protein [Candidatus Synoicihabitans sp.]|nr:heme-binding protein [Candidatus Synoicihabitans sp.]
MRWSFIGALAITVVVSPAVAKQRAVRAVTIPSERVELPGCVLQYTTQQSCTDGAIGDAAPEAFNALSAAEVQAIVEAAASALANDTATIAVVDRTGRPLAVYRQPGFLQANDDLALGVARTAAFFSNSQAPLSSRTIRFISQVHFPPGLTNTASGALYGIEQSNRGCDLNAQWNTGQCVVRARSIEAFRANLATPATDLLCNSTTSAGCGAGLVTGKIQFDDQPNPQNVANRPVRPGGIPLYRVLEADLNRGIVTKAKLVGAIGVYGIDNDTDLEEYAAVTGAFGAAGIVPVPFYPLPFPGNVFIEGIRLPFLGPNAKLRFNTNGLPIGLERPAGTNAGTANGTFYYGPFFGGCAPNGYLVGPKAGSQLSQADVDAIVQRAIRASKRTRAQVRLPLNSYARMIITVVDVDGSILAHYRMPDALFDAVDVVPAKARNVVYFNSSDPNARNDLPGVPAGTYVTTRTIGFGSQPFFPPGIDSRVFDPAPGPWFPLYLNNVNRPCSQGSQIANANQNGVTFFAGATALVRNGALVGGLGVSGDGIEQDDYVTYLGAGDLLPPTDRWADRVKIDGARLPMFKFPRNPEGVTECGGGPCS